MIQSIDRAARILSLLQGARRLGISELAAALELPPSTVHGLVKSLQEHGLVAQETRGSRYALGPALLTLSSVYLDTLDVRGRSLRRMHDLSHRTGLASRLGVAHNTDVLVIHHDRRPDGTEQMPETGITLPAHASALGKVLLAYDDAFRADVLTRDLADLTGDTVTDGDALRDQLAGVRDRALATEDEEAVIGDASIAVPVAGEDGVVVAALGVVFPAPASALDAAVLKELRDAAQAISRDLGAPGWPPRPGSGI
ncbi:IclR family transcriptional regulator [Microbacterium hominis]|uniref:Glycerol operon regulatory protein n=1 Tax=Microbacterium hominis TaxID=162426 RepID=A0A2K9DF59_9MICO|nr:MULTISPECIES: IclR family transcriptional regulator [Microbacterium]AUG30821.1 IclR family transcriptional regulator [Microbacterium hominis]QRY39451.1 IclR family transcriptional regulator [Microbacterium hominis]